MFRKLSFRLGIPLGGSALLFGFICFAFVMPKTTSQHLTLQKSIAASRPSCSEFHIPLYVVARTQIGVPFEPPSNLRLAQTTVLHSGIQPSVLLSATESDGTTQVNPGNLDSLPGIDTSGVVYAQSDNPSLRSCDLKLSDQSADGPLVSAAKSALVSAGLASEDQVDSPASIYLVSDDPLTKSLLIVTIDVPSQASKTPDGSTLYQTKPLVAFVNPASYTVSQLDVF